MNQNGTEQGSDVYLSIRTDGQGLPVQRRHLNPMQYPTH